MIPVVEQGDVPLPAKLLQKAHERTGAFGKLEAEQTFIGQAVGAPAHQVP